MFQSVKRQREYPGYRKGTPEVAGSGSSMPILIGAAMIAAAILLSTLITALGSRYAGFESPTDETAWLVDRLTGTVYKCQARNAARLPVKPRSRPAASTAGRNARTASQGSANPITLPRDAPRD